MDQKSKTGGSAESELIGTDLTQKTSKMEEKIGGKQQRPISRANSCPTLASSGKIKAENSPTSTAMAFLLTPTSTHTQLWAVLAAIVLVLLWIPVFQFSTLGDRFTVKKHGWSPTTYFRPTERVYQSNGYLMLACNGGLNQMRTGICDMVSIASRLNLTLIVPEMDNTSYWHDNSSFQDIFDVDYFIASLRDEVRILKELPPAEKERLKPHTVALTLWSRMSYYYKEILPQIKEHKILRIVETDARLANNGIPEDVQKLRCRVNYKALRFSRHIEETGRKIVRVLRQKGPFLVLHLRYEKDMLSFTGCNEGLSKEEILELTNLRAFYPWWRTRGEPSKKRKGGLCPLTPDETTLAMQALGIPPDMQIYIAAGDIYGGESKLKMLEESFPNLVRKENLLDPSDLKPSLNHSNQMAALDYIVSVESDIFLPTYGGHMAKAVEGHRRYLGFRTTITLNTSLLVSLIDQYKVGRLSWDEFCLEMRTAHADHLGGPKPRLKIHSFPSIEDNFYSNPEECLPHQAVQSSGNSSA